MRDRDTGYDDEKILFEEWFCGLSDDKLEKLAEQYLRDEWNDALSIDHSDPLSIIYQDLLEAVYLAKQYGEAEYESGD